MRRIAAVLVTAAALGALPANTPMPAREHFTVHVITNADAAFANTLIVETAGHVVVVDPGFSEAHAARVRAALDSTGKPMAAVLVTHAHIDHYDALPQVADGNVPIIASAGVARQLVVWDSINYARFGAKPPAERPGPDTIFADGQTLVLDGVTFTMYDAGPGESYSDAWWLVHAPSRRAAIIGDLAMWGLPPFAQSGHTGDWIASLERVGRIVPPDTRFYIGHDVNAAGGDVSHGADILDWQRGRLVAFRDAVLAITAGGRLLTDDEVERVTATLHDDAPENLAAFDFLIATSANVVAAELILERQKAELETMLEATLARMAEAGS